MQNWFAVLIDFVIVVVGVFVGLQVQDWNDARKDRLDERALLNRLYSETRALLETSTGELDTLRARGKALTDANPVLFSQEPPRALTTIECREIAQSHMYRRPPDELPVLDEMLETGRFDLLRDPIIKEKLRSYVILRERARALYNEMTNELFRLHSRYPDYIVVRRVPITPDNYLDYGGLSGDGYQWFPECDGQKMREDAAFLNEYADNLSRINALTEFVVRRRDHLVKLERILEEAIANKNPRIQEVN